MRLPPELLLHGGLVDWCSAVVAMDRHLIEFDLLRNLGEAIIDHP